MLELLTGSDSTNVVIGSEGLPEAGLRTYATFSDIVKESGRSRVLGGLVSAAPCLRAALAGCGEASLACPLRTQHAQRGSRPCAASPRRGTTWYSVMAVLFAVAQHYQTDCDAGMELGREVALGVLDWFTADART